MLTQEEKDAWTASLGNSRRLADPNYKLDLAEVRESTDDVRSRVHWPVYFQEVVPALLAHIDTIQAAAAPAPSSLVGEQSVADDGAARWAPEAEERDRPGIRVRLALYPNPDYQSGWDARQVVWTGTYWQWNSMGVRCEVDARFILVEAEMPQFPAPPQPVKGDSHEA